ncbi:MAG: YbaK/EbsC family protein [Acidobacteriia bacterium]|nr:YbaK/EbsC family protein [Terriglobia bacterium]
MAIPDRLKEYLEAQAVPYTHCTHRLAYTAQGVAAAQHVPGSAMVKTVIMRGGEKFFMVVLPATRKVDLPALEHALPYDKIQLASEYEFAVLFPDSEVGAMAPFGNLYGLPVFVDTHLSGCNEIVFNAGTHTDTIRMSYQDFNRLVHPTVISLTRDLVAA